MGRLTLARKRLVCTAARVSSVMVWAPVRDSQRPGSYCPGSLSYLGETLPWGWPPEYLKQVLQNMVILIW